MDTESLIESARNEIAVGRRSVAATYLECARLNAPASSRVWEQIGRLYRNLHDEKAALTCFQQALRVEPQTSKERRAHLESLRGMCLEELCRFDDAERAYSLALALSPSAPRYVLLAFMQRSRGALAAAETTLVRALATYPDYDEALLNYGLLLAESRPQVAISTLERLVSLCPEDHRAYAELGYALIWGDHLVDAELMLDRALSLKPDRLLTYLYLDVCFAKQRASFSRRRKNLVRARTAGKSFLIDLFLGDLYTEEGHRVEAQGHYERCLQSGWTHSFESYSLEDLRRGGLGLIEMRRWRMIS